MLILTRKIGEPLLIGDNIRVKVLEIRGKQVRLGIEAPADIAVLREELFQHIDQENCRAAGAQFRDLEKVVGLWNLEEPEDADKGP